MELRHFFFALAVFVADPCCALSESCKVFSLTLRFPQWLDAAPWSIVCTITSFLAEHTMRLRSCLSNYPKLLQRKYVALVVSSPHRVVLPP